MKVSLQPVGPNANIVKVGGNTFYFINKTCVAMSLNDGKEQVRRMNNSLNWYFDENVLQKLGVRQFAQISDELFEEVLEA